MSLVIRAVETYGQTDAYRLIESSRDFPQSEESIAWVIDELNDEQTGRHENYANNLSMALVEADPALLLPREAALLEARHFLPGCVSPSPSGCGSAGFSPADLRLPEFEVRSISHKSQGLRRIGLPIRPRSDR